MKKQILILAFFVLAMMAGSLNSFGQLLPATKPIVDLSCVATSEPLHPFPGVPYEYALDGTTGADVAKNYTWWATQDKNFVTAQVAPTPILAPTDLVGTNYSGRLVTPVILNPSANYGAVLGAPATVTITWSADILSKTKYQATATDNTAGKFSTFVVGYSQGTNCADNLQVFEIDPMPNFTVDITPVDPADDLTPLAWNDVTTGKLCVDEVQSAVYNAGAIDMDYGTNTFYYEVTAANFVKDWTPSFSIKSGLRVSQTATLSMYTTLAAAKLGAVGTDLATSGALPIAQMSTTAGTFSWAPGVALTASVPADVSTGVSVWVKVVVDNNKEESLTDNPFVLAVDARDNTSTGIWDMEDGDCATLADAADAIDDATITVNPRPTLLNATVVTSPDTYIIKTP